MKSAANFYQLLGIKQNANTEEIKKAYRKLALRYHPDRNNGDKEAEGTFIQLTQAYDTLTDPYKRILYDDELAQANLPAPPPNPYAQHKYPPPRAPFVRMSEQPVGWKPYAFVVFVFFLIVMLSVWLTPKQPKTQIIPGMYSIIDEQGNVLFDSDNAEEIRQFLKKQQSQNPELYRQLDSLIQE